uniref:Uncharacterized protein n=1 Tax=Lactuca sativa TaxID=4236 RepID=A0A9R1URB3_LACSA|nr:hypothetical protein LSAT_V11C800388530 [Lactuca sativa]
MTSGDNGSSSGTPASPIQPMVVLEETPPPIVVAREMPDKGDLVVTVEPPGRQQQTAGKEHFPSAVVQTTVILAQTLQPSATPPTAKPPVPPLQPVPVQLTMHPPPFFKTPPMGQMATTQPIISQMPPLFNPMAREQQTGRPRARRGTNSRSLHVGAPTRYSIPNTHGQETEDKGRAKRESGEILDTRGGGGNEAGIPKRHDHPHEASQPTSRRNAQRE